MNSLSFDDAVARILNRDSRFNVKAYTFLNLALDWTVRRFEESTTSRENSHVSGQELLKGFCDFALEQFGPMAYTVLREWGITSGVHIGEMVFLLIEESVFSKQDGDSLDDFKGGPSFKALLYTPFEISDQEVYLD